MSEVKTKNGKTQKSEQEKTLPVISEDQRKYAQMELEHSRAVRQANRLHNQLEATKQRIQQLDNELSLMDIQIQAGKK